MAVGVRDDARVTTGRGDLIRILGDLKARRDSGEIKFDRRMRNVRDRLIKELESNVALRIEETGEMDALTRSTLLAVHGI